MKGKRKRTWQVLAALTVLACLLVLAGCDEAPVPTSLSVDTAQAKTVYAVRESFDATGIVAKVRMSDGTDGEVDPSEVRYGGYDMSSPGRQLVTASYNGLTDRFQISVKSPDAKVESVMIRDKSKYEKPHVVEAGSPETYGKPADMKLEVRYSDRTSEIVDVQADWISFGGGWDGTMAEGQYPVTVTYKDGDTVLSDTYTVTVQNYFVPAGAELTDVMVMNEAKYARTYVEGEYAYPTDMKLLLTYSDGTSNVVTADPAKDFGVKNGGGATVSLADMVAGADPYTVTVSQTIKDVTKSATYEVNIVAMSAAKAIRVSSESTMPRSFAVGTQPDYDGLVLEFRYDDDMVVTKKLSDLTDLDVGEQIVPRGPNGEGLQEGKFAVAGKWTVTITYTPADKKPVTARSLAPLANGALTCSYEVEVTQEAKVESVSILDKHRYEVSVERDSWYDLPEGMTLEVRYNDGTVGTVAVTSSMVDETVDTRMAGANWVLVTYEDPRYPGNKASDKYLVTVVDPAIKDVALGAPAVAVSLDGAMYVWRVRMTSPIAGAKYFYRYGTDYEAATWDQSEAGERERAVDVEIPYTTTAGMKVWLTKVEATGYTSYEGSVLSEVLPLTLDRTVTITENRSDEYDWKVTLSTPIEGSVIEYRYSTDLADAGWREYEGTAISVFPSDVDANVDDIRIEARVKTTIIGSESPVARSQEFGRVPMVVEFTYGYMNGAEADLADTDENAALGRYPTITAQVAVTEEYAWKASLSSDPDKEYTDPLNADAVKLAVTSGDSTTVIIEAPDPSKELMSRRFESAERTWTKGTTGTYALKGTGPMGGKIVLKGSDENTWYETVVPDKLTQPYWNVCSAARVEMDYSDLSDRKPEWSTMHNTQECIDARCQLFTYLHPFGGMQPQNLLLELQTSPVEQWSYEQLLQIVQVCLDTTRLDESIYVPTGGLKVHVGDGLDTIEFDIYSQVGKALDTYKVNVMWPLAWAFGVREGKGPFCALTYRPF